VEIVVRAAVVFLVLWLVTRVVGRSTLGELSTFQLVLFVTMGDLVQQGVTQQDYSLTGAVLAVSTFALLTVAISWVNARWPRVRSLTHGIPVVLVDEGEPVLRTMRSERISVDDLFAAAREQGIERIADVRIAVLEADGKISFFQRTDQGSEGAPEKPTVG
jgi:uncharacterized membrane protein YcaP (DUF421 family)